MRPFRRHVDCSTNGMPPSSSRQVVGLLALVVVPLVLATACGDTAGAPPSSPPDSSVATTDAAEDAQVSSDGPTDAGDCVSDVAPGPGILSTKHGAVRGALEGPSYAFRNIPYAAPPVGALRWKAPSPATCWKGARDGAGWGPQCPQFQDNGAGPMVGNEDCLQLNVFAPAAKAGPLPIMVWIHGGGHVAGSAGEESSGVRIYDGGALAAKEGVLVVSMNYRLGVLGFLAHPLLAAETSSRTEGNFGILDVIAALDWVKANAGAMGGDASRVTIFGESAGGVNVCALVASPLAKGLFAGAIIQSGGCVAKTRTEAEAFGAKVFAASKCDVAPDPLACMRALPAESAVAALPVKTEVAGAIGGYGTVDDGYVLVGKPLDTIAAGRGAKVPMIVGTNKMETSRSVPIPLTATEAQYEAAVRSLFAGAADRVLAEYPVSDYASPWDAYVALTTDAKFTCGARRVLGALAASSTPAYRYFFSHVLDNGSPIVKKIGASHGVDVLYTFDHLNIAGYVEGPGDRVVADAFTRRWASFAKNPADPNGGATPAWPAYSSATDPYLELDSPVRTGEGLRRSHCDFWEAFAP